MSLFDTAAKVGEFLLEHGEIIDAAKQAIDGGTPRAVIVAAIKEVMVKMSDEAMREELGG